jgi:hypothetical protein
MKKFVVPFTLFAALFLTLSTSASAQTKSSGTNVCAKADPQNMISIPDHDGHSYVIGQAKCSWSKQMKIGEDLGKAGTASFSGEMHGNTMAFHAYYVDEMTNGDKAFYEYHGTIIMKDGANVSEKGTWTMTGGTGKIKGYTGKGTYTSKPNADGGSTAEVVGDYMPPKM